MNVTQFDDTLCQNMCHMCCPDKPMKKIYIWVLTVMTQTETLNDISFSFFFLWLSFSRLFLLTERF